MFKGKHQQRNQDKCWDDTSLVHLTQLSIKPTWNISALSCSSHTSLDGLIFQHVHMLSAVMWNSKPWSCYGHLAWCMDIWQKNWNYRSRQQGWQMMKRTRLTGRGHFSWIALWGISLRCLPVCFRWISRSTTSAVITFSSSRNLIMELKNRNWTGSKNKRHLKRGSLSPSKSCCGEFTSSRLNSSFVACIFGRLSNACVSFVLCLTLQDSLLFIWNPSKGNVVFEIRLTFSCHLPCNLWMVWFSLLIRSPYRLICVESADRVLNRWPEHNNVYFYIKIFKGEYSWSFNVAFLRCALPFHCQEKK